MEQFCQNPRCANPGAKVVLVSFEQRSGESRTLCGACETAYRWGVQHGAKVTQARMAGMHAGVTLQVDRREIATILAALRYFADENLQGTTGIPDRLAERTATGGGHFKALDFEEVGRLCQRLKPAWYRTPKHRPRRRKRPG